MLALQFVNLFQHISNLLKRRRKQRTLIFLLLLLQKQTPTQALVRRFFPLLRTQLFQNTQRTCLATLILDDEEILWSLTAFTKEEFEELFNICKSELMKPIEGTRFRNRWLNDKELLLLLLVWIRRYYKYTELSIWFGLSQPQIFAYIHSLVPRLAELLKPQVQFPSEQRLQLLRGTIEKYPDAVGYFDMMIHVIRQPTWGEYRFFRGDKGTHFFNHLGMVDFRGLFINFEPGFAGRFPDRRAFQESELREQLVANNVEGLADNGFTGEDQTITPSEVNGIRDRWHMANRARIENSWGEMRAESQSATDPWRHKRSLEPATMQLNAELFNFRKRRRLQKGLHAVQGYLNELA